jgi:hypothetical protein
MEYVLVLIVLAVVIYAISAPLRADRVAAATGASGEPVRQDPVLELEAARDAKYREIRDAELDVRTGKLSDADYAALDGTLRAEAVEILHRLDHAREPDSETSNGVKQLPSEP